MASPTWAHHSPLTIHYSLFALADHQLLIEAAEERALAHTLAARRRQPVSQLLAPQVERERLEQREHRPPQIAQRIPPARPRIIDHDDPASRLDHAGDLAERALAHVAGLLVQ